MNYNDFFIEDNLPEPLSESELNSYFEKMKSGDLEARDIIIRHNISLAFSRAIYQFYNIPYEKKELISISLIGLIKSVDTFDTSKKTTFATYACRCIDNEILMFLRKEKKHVLDCSLDSTLTNEASKNGKDFTLQDTNIIVDTNENIIENYEKKETNLIINQIINNLSPRDKEIIMLHFGFINDTSITQSEISNKLNISQSYVSRIIRRTLKQIEAKLKEQEIIEKTDEDKNPQNNEINKKKNAYIRKSLQNIYDYFNQYSKEQIDEMLSKLTDEEKKLVTLRYGEDLNNPVPNTEWKKEERYKFYKILIPKMKKLLANPEYKKENIIRKKLQSIYDYFNQYSKEQIDEMLSKLTDEEKKLVTLRYGENLNNPVTSPEWKKEYEYKFYKILMPKMKKLLANPEYKQKQTIKKEKKSDSITLDTSKPQESLIVNEIQEEDYIKVLELLKTPSFNKLLTVLSVKEAVIVSLKLGYIDGKYFSTDSISTFLGIDPQEIRDTTKNFLCSYKEYINNSIDNIIKIATDQPVTLKKKK